jgi:NAD(P)-dependent dehydrogenase (short-subunit alcohol dehydrogenase family)
MSTTPSTALVTAGASGLGLEIVTRLRRDGWSVAAVDIDTGALSRLAARDPEVLAMEADVGDADAVADAVEQTAARFGGLDALVNNAGIPGPRVPLADIDPDEWRRVFDVNVHGAFYAIRAAVPWMRERGGAVINISSTSARTGLPNRSSYVTSKVALEGLTRNAARELGPYGIRCNAVLPGYMDNPRGRALITKHAEETGIDEEAAREKFLRFISMRTMIGMDEVAAMVAFLLSDEAAHVSGQFIGVCGNQEYEV